MVMDDSAFKKEALRDGKGLFVPSLTGAASVVFKDKLICNGG